MSSIVKFHKIPLIFIVTYSVLFLFFASCNTSPYYQKQQGIPAAQWAINFQPVFDIDIPDTTHQYITYIIFRHGEDYPFSNLWLDMKIKSPDDKSFDAGKRIEVPLADINGKWLAKGISGIWEHRIPISFKDAPAFTKEGEYQIKLTQLMRKDPLPAALNVGIRVEKIDKKTAISK